MADKMMQASHRSDVEGVSVDSEYLSDYRNGALCTHHKHSNYAADRLLREGSRVTVAVAKQNKDDPWYVTELRCLYCPLSFDLEEVVGDWSVYDESNVILAEATLAPDPDNPDSLVLTEPRILSAKATLPGM